MTPSHRLALPLAARATVPVVLLASIVPAAVYVLDRLTTAYLRDPAAPTSAWWPPAAVGFAIVLFAPRRWRWFLLTAVVVANYLSIRHGTRPLPVSISSFYAAVNVVDGGIAAAVFLRVSRRRPGQALLHDPLDTMKLVVACVCGAGLAAFAVACRAMYNGTAGVFDLTRSYLSAHLVGLAVITPALVLAPRTRAAWRSQLGGTRRNLEWATHLAVTGALCAWLFLGSARPSELVLVAVPLLISAMRLEPLRAMSVVAVYCVLATAGTIGGHGALGVIADATTRQWALQAIVGVGAFLALFVSLTGQDRVAANRRAHSAERLVTQAFEATPQPLCVTRLDAERSGEILQVNQALCDLLWRTREDLIGCSSRSLVTTPPSTEGASLSLDMIEGRIDRHRIEREMIRSDGLTIPVIQDIAVVRPHDAVAYLVVAITDLRPDRDAQQLLLDALRAEADAAVSLRRAAEKRKALAARTTHDLRTPLMSVQGYLDVVLDDDRIEPEQRSMIEIASRNTGRVLDLVDDLVTIAGLESTDTAEPEAPRRISPDAVVDVAIDSIMPICARKSQRLLRPDMPTGVLVDADRVMFERAVLNVVSNAAKYTPDGGMITVRTVTDGEWVSVVVADTGIGIPARDLPRIGEQFFRARTARDSAIPGTGLGLAITRTVLERHGGSLDIASTPGVGTTVTLTLPVVARRFEPVIVREAAAR